MRFEEASPVYEIYFADDAVSPQHRHELDTQNHAVSLLIVTADALADPEAF